MSLSFKIRRTHLIRLLVVLGIAVWVTVLLLSSRKIDEQVKVDYQNCTVHPKLRLSLPKDDQIVLHASTPRDSYCFTKAGSQISVVGNGDGSFSVTVETVAHSANVADNACPSGASGSFHREKYPFLEDAVVEFCEELTYRRSDR